MGILEADCWRVTCSAELTSWVIWSTSVTVESEGSFLGLFVFFESLKKLERVSLSKVWAEVVGAKIQNGRRRPP